MAAVQKRIWKEEASRRFLGCLKCQPGRIYVLLADINVSVVFHEVNNEKVSPCPQNRRRARGCFNICSSMAKSIPTNSNPLKNGEFL